MNHSDSLGELFSALSKAQGEIKVAVFDKKANYGPYASFKSVKEACAEALLKHGLAIAQPVDYQPDYYILHTILGHAASGQYIASSIRLLIDRNNMQGMGSAVTYAKRYSYAAMVGVVADDDDDGNKALPESQQKDPPVDKKPKDQKKPKLPKLTDPMSDELEDKILNLAIDRDISPSELEKLVFQGYGLAVDVRVPNWIALELVKLLENPETNSLTLIDEIEAVKKRREAKAKGGK